MTPQSAVVITDPNSAYVDRVGFKIHDDPRWFTVGIKFGCVVVRFERDQFRALTPEDEICLV